MYLQLEAALELSIFQNEAAFAAIETFDWSNMSQYVQKQFDKLTDIGTAILPEDDVNRVRLKHDKKVVTPLTVMGSGLTLGQNYIIKEMS